MSSVFYLFLQPKTFKVCHRCNFNSLYGYPMKTSSTHLKQIEKYVNLDDRLCPNLMISHRTVKCVQKHSANANEGEFHQFPSVGGIEPEVGPGSKSQSGHNHRLLVSMRTVKFPLRSHNGTVILFQKFVYITTGDGCLICLISESPIWFYRTI